MSIYLTRHAHTEWNGPPKRFQGHVDISISEKGKYQAQQLSQKFPKVNEILCSPAKRCLETAKLLYPNLPIKIDGRLWERDMGILSGLSQQEVEENYPHKWQQMVEDPENVCFDKMEALANMQKRLIECLSSFAKHTNPDGNYMIVTHGGCIRLLWLMRSNSSLKDFYKTQVDNLSLYTLCRYSLVLESVSL